MAKLNIDKNKPNVAGELPTHNGIKVLKVLKAVIADDGEFYKCIMEDGRLQDVPTSLFKEV